jgi:hypothetical protein
MRTEKEIRQYRDDLRVATSLPCNCDRTGHGQECYEGGLMAKAVIRALSWAIGEDDGFQDVVDYCHMHVSIAKAGSGIG